MHEFPRVGVGMLIVDNGKYLLAKRKKSPEAGCWGILGGKLELGEELQVAAAREAEEECQMRVNNSIFLGLSEQIDIDGQHWVSAIYLANQTTGKASITEPESFTAMDWFSFEMLPEPLTKAATDAIAMHRNSEQQANG